MLVKWSWGFTDFSWCFAWGFFHGNGSGENGLLFIPEGVTFFVALWDARNPQFGELRHPVITTSEVGMELFLPWFCWKTIQFLGGFGWISRCDPNLVSSVVSSVTWRAGSHGPYRNQWFLKKIHLVRGFSSQPCLMRPEGMCDFKVVPPIFFSVIRSWSCWKVWNWLPKSPGQQVLVGGLAHVFFSREKMGIIVYTHV